MLGWVLTIVVCFYLKVVCNYGLNKTAADWSTLGPCRDLLSVLFTCSCESPRDTANNTFKKTKSSLIFIKNIKIILQESMLTRMVDIFTPWDYVSDIVKDDWTNPVQNIMRWKMPQRNTFDDIWTFSEWPGLIQAGPVPHNIGLVPKNSILWDWSQNLKY